MTSTITARPLAATFLLSAAAAVVIHWPSAFAAPDTAAQSHMTRAAPAAPLPLRFELEAAPSPALGGIATITAHLRNASPSVVPVVDSMRALANIQVSVQRDGRPLAPTAYGRRILAPEWGVRSRQAIYVAPNSRVSYRLWVGALYDMSEAGTYTVHARFLLDSLTGQTLPAPPLTVRVRPAPVASLESRGLVAPAPEPEASLPSSAGRPLQMQLATTPAPLASNRLTTILVRLRNASSRSVVVPDARTILRWLRLQVLHGVRPAAATAVGRKYLQQKPGAPRMVSLAPHSTLAYRLAVGALYDMTEAGAYTIHASLQSGANAPESLTAQPLMLEVKNNPLVLGLPLAPKDAAAIQAYVEEMFKAAPQAPSSG